MDYIFYETLFDKFHNITNENCEIYKNFIHISNHNWSNNFNGTDKRK
jgi:hypothetical protein